MFKFFSIALVIAASVNFAEAWDSKTATQYLMEKLGLEGLSAMTDTTKVVNSAAKHFDVRKTSEGWNKHFTGEIQEDILCILTSSFEGDMKRVVVLNQDGQDIRSLLEGKVENKTEKDFTYEQLPANEINEKADKAGIDFFVKGVWNNIKTNENIEPRISENPQAAVVISAFKGRDNKKYSRPVIYLKL